MFDLTHIRAVRPLGDIIQLGFVPRDWDAALDYWIRQLGVGPFFVLERVAADEVRYRGHRTEIDFTVALSYWNDVQIELIRQNNREPSIYEDWLQSGRVGLHHVGVRSDDIDAALQACAAEGGTIVQEFYMPGGVGVYVEFGPTEPLVELLQFPDKIATGFAAMRDAARAWDGSDPVRMR